MLSCLGLPIKLRSFRSLHHFLSQWTVLTAPVSMNGGGRLGKDRSLNEWCALLYCGPRMTLPCLDGQHQFDGTVELTAATVNGAECAIFSVVSVSFQGYKSRVFSSFRHSSLDLFELIQKLSEHPRGNRKPCLFLCGTGTA